MRMFKFLSTQITLLCANAAPCSLSKLFLKMCFEGKCLLEAKLASCWQLPSNSLNHINTRNQHEERDSKVERASRVHNSESALCGAAGIMPSNLVQNALLSFHFQHFYKLSAQTSQLRTQLTTSQLHFPRYYYHHNTRIQPLELLVRISQPFLWNKSCTKFNFQPNFPPLWCPYTGSSRICLSWLGHG